MRLGRPRLRLLPVVVTCLLPSAWAAAQDAVNLRPVWEAGQTARYSFWHQRDQTTAMSFRGQSRQASSRITTEGELVWTVDKVRADGSYDCTLTFDWMQATFEAEGEKQVCDSRKGSGDIEPVQKLIKAMVSTPTTYRVAADGSIESVEGVSKMRQKVGKDLEEMVPEELDFIESASDMATLPFAPASLEVGGGYDGQFRWTHDMGHMEYDWSFELAGVDTMAGVPVATVAGEADLALEVDRSEMPTDGPPIDVRLVSGEASTQVFFDLHRHEAVGRNTGDRQEIAITITLPDGAGQMKRTVTVTNQSQSLRLEEGGGD